MTAQGKKPGEQIVATGYLQILKFMLNATVPLLGQFLLLSLLFLMVPLSTQAKSLGSSQIPSWLMIIPGKLSFPVNLLILIPILVQTLLISLISTCLHLSSEQCLFLCTGYDHIIALLINLQRLLRTYKINPK